jgi:hypothetical protein
MTAIAGESGQVFGIFTEIRAILRSRRSRTAAGFVGAFLGFRHGFLQANIIHIPT